ncbi:MAG: hypothetical protein H6Q73_2417 [Firmicutes bacterium]|nr:hypothetical protein [Bacillota bacterium]
MKKVCLLAFLLLFLTSAVCAASPLADCSLGEIAFNLDLGVPSISDNSTKVDGKHSLGYGVTAGVGFGFAGHYSYDNFETKSPLHASSEIKAQQICLVNNLFDLVGNISIFGGVSQTQVVGSSKHNGLVVGVAGSVPLGFNTKAYAVLTGGTRISGYEAGLSYEFTDHADLTLGYRDTKYKDLTFNDGSSSDATVKGLVGGVSFKF